MILKRGDLERKLLQRKCNFSSESREGVTYQSGIAASHVYNDSQIPILVTNPECEKLSSDIVSNSKKVFCDIETTSLHGDADIIHIAAICDRSKFNKYISPSQAISTSASVVTQLTCGNVLLYQGKPVPSVDSIDGFMSFITWLESHAPCILIGHNFNKFDFPRILRAFEMSGLTQCLETTVLGTVDTYPLFKQMFSGLESYSQEHIVSVFVQEKYEAHNAMNDVLSLQKLCNVVGVFDEQLSTSSCSVKSAVRKWRYKEAGQENAVTLNCLKQYKVVSARMTDKIAQSGLRVEHLKRAVSCSGLDGLTQLPKPRVSKRTNIIVDIYNSVNSAL